MRPSQASETCGPAHVTPPSSPPPLRIQRACVSSTRSVPPPATLRRRVSRGRLRRPPVFFALRTRGGQPAGRGGAGRAACTEPLWAQAAQPRAAAWELGPAEAAARGCDGHREPRRRPPRQVPLAQRRVKRT